MTNTLDGTVGHVVQAGAIHGDITLAAPQWQTWQMPPPVQLPPPPRLWVDRAEELARLHHAAQTTAGPAVLVISGASGTGKTGLALVALSQTTDRFDGGQLYARLGAGPAQDPVSWLGRWLRALGVPPPCVPTDPHELVGLWRTVAARRRLAILIEDVACADQAQPLLPATGSSLVVITARQPLPELVPLGALTIGLGPLDAPAATELLQQLLAAADRPPLSAAAPLAERCGGLPLAITALAARIAADPDPAAAAAELDHLGAPMDVPSAVEACYQRLSSDAARLYRLMGTHPGPHFDARAAAAALEVDAAAAQALLHQLADAGLLTPAGQQRWAWHDLTRPHAAAKAQQEPAPQQQATRQRLLDYYRDTALAARAGAAPYLSTPGGDQVPGFADRGQALEWLQAEHPTLVAVAAWAHQHQLHRDAWLIVHGMWPLYLHHRPSDWIDTDQLGLAAARAAGDPAAEARMLDRLGAAYQHAQLYAQAAAHFTAAEQIWHRLDDTHKIAGSVRRRAGVAGCQGRDQDAITLFGTAIDRHRALGETRHMALAMIGLAEAHTRAGQPQAARTAAEEAVNLCNALSDTPRADPYNQARAQITLAGALTELGDHAAAHEHLLHAHQQMHHLGSPHGQATALEALANLSHRAGRAEEAHAYAHRAQAIRTGLNQPPGQPR